MKMNKSFLLQAAKYGVIGVINTLLTAVIIWIMMHLVFQTGKTENVSPTIITLSNITGYIVGLINSFIWNRKWTFQSKNRWEKEFVKFSFAFLVCYIPQLLFVNFLNTYTDFRIEIGRLTISHGYTCQLIGIVFYTSLNFLLNKYYTFRPENNNSLNIN